MKPSNFTEEPWNSVFKKKEHEIIARNIMVIKKRLGDEWGELGFKTYKEERLKDGNFSEDKERPIFEEVSPYTESPQKAALFSQTWGNILENET